ncbi:hypothetical protein [Kitasatospora sp. NPDC090091]|uniref:hypothetical protein n=1 Tax=Kitasatospora sp. NPDC090091 TaxID=3364081 RepID=UPI003811E093
MPDETHSTTSPARSKVRPWQISTASALVLVLAVAGLWQWKPWQSVDLPASSCWGLLTRDQVRPLVGDDGKGTEWSTGGDLSARTPDVTCAIAWQPKGGVAAVEVKVRQENESSHRSVVEELTRKSTSGEAKPLRFGDGTEAWLRLGFFPTVLIRCDSHHQAQPDAVYRRIEVSGDLTLSDLSDQKRAQAFVDLAHRTAKEIVRQEGCTDVHLADQAPTVPGP